MYKNYEKYANGSRKELLTPDRYMDVLDQMVMTYGIEKPGKKKRISAIKYPLNTVAPFQRIFTELGPCTAFNPGVGIYYTPLFLNSSKQYDGFVSIWYDRHDYASWIIKEKTTEEFTVFFHSPAEVMEIMDWVVKVPSRTIKSTRYEVITVLISPSAENLTVLQKDCRMWYDQTDHSLDHSPVYSHNLCKFECRIRLALRFCQCTPYYYRRLDGERICNMSGMYCLSKHAGT
ncbi:uncharacterized protein LOC132702135 [Cylas formicarius]|uniref:uncharacterized protein LOC132702135 n=1 Tax=Cylas formicarius TaxID=197179 RepID=UPI002958A44A|nr:uncharacterized protein LOC132702135 [Cylas formicarius]